MPTLLLLLRPTLRRQRRRSREVPPKQDLPTRFQILSVSDHLSKFRLTFLILFVRNQKVASARAEERDVKRRGEEEGVALTPAVNELILLASCAR